MKKVFLCALLCISSFSTAWSSTKQSSRAPACKRSLPIAQIAPIYEQTYPFSLPPLPYAYDALEPHIDKMTMEIHHDKHHQAYVDNLNAALKDHPTLQQKNLFELLTTLDKLPASVRNAIRNQGGGHFNHSLFWTMMTPDKTSGPTGQLKKRIEKDFSSFANFQEQFNAAAKTVFGSGWAWLVSDKKGKLSVIATHNQDSSVNESHFPILALDVWEHAYYLKYQNRRGDYITAFWQVINWPLIEQYYEKIMN